MTNHRQWTLQIRKEMAIERFKKMDKEQREKFSRLFGYIDNFTVLEAESACVLMDKVIDAQQST